MTTLKEVTSGSPYVSYAYAYPHKSAYRHFEPPIPLVELWGTERRESLFLYLHVPFCEYRCGFCNLFTQARPAAALPNDYLAQLERECERVRGALGDARFARMAIGGGTPTFLDVSQLDRLFRIASSMTGVTTASIPVSIEASPATIDGEKLAFLRALGIERLSIGVQSVDDEVSAALGRPQRATDALTALASARDARFPVLNVDLIYGGESRRTGSWRDTVRQILQFRPEEIYLYPLYVRALTGLGRQPRSWDDDRLNEYRVARSTLLSAGYRQVSMRMFALETSPRVCSEYSCQSDGMVGLGCGARSYTTTVHYSTEYAVGKAGIMEILSNYLNRDPGEFLKAHYGFRLDEDEQRRRFVILSLLQATGLSRVAYRERFGTDPIADYLELSDLAEHALATIDDERIVLTDAGLELSDALGPWLYSDSVKRLSEGFACL
jgi:oxygen-independent coproporphyrinogen-3 oxidase